MIRTTEAPGELKILESKHQGSLISMVFGGNLDHAGAANDGLAGCVVGLEVFRRLRGRKTRFTYSLVLSPGIIGSELYLAGLTPVRNAAGYWKEFSSKCWGLPLRWQCRSPGAAWSVLYTP